jgi:hypothetical protein
MKLSIVLFLCLIATPAMAQQSVFRGGFIETYMAEAGFLDTIPRGTRLNCEEQLCSHLKSVRIYVFMKGATTKKFWSTDYADVMFDGPETLLTCGNDSHIIYYDETNQLMYLDQECNRAAIEVTKRSTIWDRILLEHSRINL